MKEHIHFKLTTSPIRCFQQLFIDRFRILVNNVRVSLIDIRTMISYLLCNLRCELLWQFGIFVKNDQWPIRPCCPVWGSCQNDCIAPSTRRSANEPVALSITVGLGCREPILSRSPVKCQTTIRAES